MSNRSPMLPEMPAPGSRRVPRARRTNARTSLAIRNPHVPLERMLSQQCRMKDLDEICQDEVGMRHASRPIVIGPGGRKAAFIHPHLFLTIRVERDVARFVFEHRCVAGPTATIDPD